MSKKEEKTCEGCGLEAADNPGEPFDLTKPPCCYCKRNADAEQGITDFYSETWFLDSDNTPTIEDPDPHEHALLHLLNDTELIYGARR